MLDYRILGPVEVVGEHGPVALAGQKLRLLGLLLIHHGETLSTDRIVEELWGEHPPRTVTASLQNTVAQLRRLLGDEAILTKPAGYVLALEREQLDANRFERIVTEARSAEPAERAMRLRDGLALWRGPPLGGLDYESFAQHEIRRLEDLRVGALEERIDADLQLGQSAELVAELEALVEQYPGRERLCGELMLSLYRSGRQAEAIEAYNRLRTRLAEEQGLDPKPALQQLFRKILRQETGLEPAHAPEPVDDHIGEVTKALLAGRLVPVLGADVGVSLNGDRLPTAAEVATHLATSFDCPTEHARDLAQVAEYVSLTQGVGPLYNELHSLFARDYTPGPAHRLLAEIAGELRARGAPHQLIVTTNFDEGLEQAFREAGEEFDVVAYLAVGRHRGKFLHLPPDGPPTPVDVPNAYSALVPDERTVILKVHGRIDRQPEREWESFVVSEDDHIDYLAQSDIAALIPVTLAAKLRRSHFLFLGYPLDEWSLRVFIHRIWGRERVSFRSWAISRAPGRIERALWRDRGIEIVDMPLAEYVEQTKRRLALEVA